MASQRHHLVTIFNFNLRKASAILLLALVTVCLGSVAQAQTFSVLHTFTNGLDGAYPSAGGLTIDHAGNIYGTTAFGGVRRSECSWNGPNGGCGTVFRMVRKGSGWLLQTLYDFHQANDGYTPDQILSFGPDGSLYGSTFYGPGSACGGDGCGTAFKLRPPATNCKTANCLWTETMLYQFQGYPDGSQPAGGRMTFDSAGNIYSTTSWGGTGYYYGNVYELTPSGSGYTESVLFNFTSVYTGGASRSGVIFDQAGNLYGTGTNGGGPDSAGVLFQLTPSAYGWTEHVLHSFVSATDGATPGGALVTDPAGNLYGVTTSAGPNGGGTVWKLSPSGDSWTFSVLYAFTGTYDQGPFGGLVIDAGGNLYGATYAEGRYGAGTVFKLSPSNGGWTYTSLYDFTGGSDGANPSSGLARDASGNLYGVTEWGGSGQGEQGYGVVWELTP